MMKKKSSSSRDVEYVKERKEDGGEVIMMMDLLLVSQITLRMTTLLEDCKTLSYRLMSLAGSSLRE